jgi:hypothetical protein
MAVEVQCDGVAFSMALAWVCAAATVATACWREVVNSSLHLM